MLELVSRCIAIVTLLSLFLIIYHHILYPIILQQIYKKRAVCLGRYDADHEHIQQWPHITLVIPAYNEAEFIADKLYNLASLDYPAECLDIICIDDGSTDETVDIMHTVCRQAVCHHLNITIKTMPSNQGKTHVLNTFITEYLRNHSRDNALVAFSDTSALLSLDALRIVAQRFQQNPTIGVVNGLYTLLNSKNSSEAIYWDYQRKMNTAEELLGSALGSHGAFYCVRGHLLDTVDDNTINDDFIIPMKIVEQGYQSVYDHRITILELEPSSPSMNWQRRIRIAMGNFQQVIVLKRLFNVHRYKGITLTFLSVRHYGQLCLFCYYFVSLVVACYLLIGFFSYVQWHKQWSILWQ